MIRSITRAEYLFCMCICHSTLKAQIGIGLHQNIWVHLTFTPLIKVLTSTQDSMCVWFAPWSLRFMFQMLKVKVVQSSFNLEVYYGSAFELIQRETNMHSFYKRQYYDLGTRRELHQNTNSLCGITPSLKYHFIFYQM